MMLKTDPNADIAEYLPSVVDHDRKAAHAYDKAIADGLLMYQGTSKAQLLCRSTLLNAQRRATEYHAKMLAGEDV